jgi:hypothetical protein
MKNKNHAKKKTLVIDIRSNQVIDTLDTDISHADARFCLDVACAEMHLHLKDPDNKPVPKMFETSLGLLDAFPNVTFASEWGHNGVKWFSDVRLKQPA